MRYPLPYAFARTHQLLLEDQADELTLCVHPDSGASAINEVMRKYPVRHLQTLPAPALIQRISAAYAQGESSAAAARNLGRRADHPHAQCAADPGRARWRQRHPH